ncbi:MAG: tetratricopeptide repeat protein [Burkholderiales bacterium]
MLKTLQKKLRLRRSCPSEAPDPKVLSDVASDEATAEFHFRIGADLCNAGQLEEALESFERAVEIRADYATAHLRQGELLLEMGRNEDAADSFALALAHDEHLAGAWFGYGKLLRRAGRLEDAIVHLKRAVAESIDASDAWIELGLASNEFGQTEAAADAYEHAIRADPDRPAGYINLGLLYLSQLGDACRAEMLFRRAIDLAPDRIEPHANLGLALHEQGRSQECLSNYDQLVEAHPDCSEYRWHRGCVRLSIGDFERGWLDHEARKLRLGRWRRPLPFPEWDGSSDAAGKLLVYAEQGLGDEIMFASCLPDVLQISQRCIIECDARLASLFQRSFPKAQVHGVDRAVDDLSWLAEHADITAQCAIGSLPQYFRRSSKAFEGRGPYLVADPHLVDRWRERLRSAGHGLKVGIAWRGGTYKTRRELRSTALTQWQPVLSEREVQFFALQSASHEELQELRRMSGLSIHERPDITKDVDELAALIACLDLIITVQGTTAHLAGAQGRPVWILLNYSAEWRYMNAGERMPWYPSAKLFRQTTPGAWDALFDAAAHELNGLASDASRIWHSPR